MSAPRLIVDYAELPSLAGRDLGASSWLPINQQRVNDFAAATGDDNWIHVDTERAAREIGGTIAHGLLTLSLIPVLAQELIAIRGAAQILNYGLQNTRFPQAVHVGSAVRLHQTCLTVEARGPGLQLTFECSMEVQGETKPACVTQTMIFVTPETRERSAAVT